VAADHRLLDGHFEKADPIEMLAFAQAARAVPVLKGVGVLTTAMLAIAQVIDDHH
jgi:hypothetical protein